jgi:hypothetical protein
MLFTSTVEEARRVTWNETGGNFIVYIILFHLAMSASTIARWNAIPLEREERSLKVLFVHSSH